MNDSNIFTDVELDALKRRLTGDKSDPTGVYSARVKPKVIELLQWMKKADELKKMIQSKRK